jgi:hypothetical protein
MRIGISANRRIIVGRKKDAIRNGISIRITGTARSLSIAGNRTSNCPLLETALSAMVMIGMIDLIGSIKPMISDLMSRLGGEPQFMIGWGAGSVWTTDLVTMLDTFLGTKRNLKRWQMHEFPMSSYFAEMPILTEWSQEEFVGNQKGNRNFLHGA